MNTRFQSMRQSVFLTTLSAVLIVSSLMGALSLVPGVPSIAQAAGGGGDKKITICRATGNPTHPYIEITISVKESQHGHEGDIIPAPPGGCPGANNPPPTVESTLPPPTNPPPTAVPPTATQHQPTATYTATATLLPQPTNTFVPPTETPLSNPTNTALPSATNTKSVLPSPTNTARPTATSTRIPPTATLPPTPTRTPLPLPTATPKPGCYVFGSLDVPQTIPDGNLTGVDSVLVIPSPGVIITSVAVRVDRLSHTYDSDLQISLTAPNGLNILVADQVGGDGDNFLGTILDDAGLLPIVNGLAPFTGNFRPDNPLFQVNNLNSAGTWKLHVVDLSVGDAGSLNAWSLEVCGSPVR
jgi:subtilisin-like proprotein convertase family protein